MNLRFALRHARREGRSSLRRIGLYMAAITLGVAAIVAINSFRGNIIDAIRSESRSLLGADLEIHSRRVFPDVAENIADRADRYRSGDRLGRGRTVFGQTEL